MRLFRLVAYAACSAILLPADVLTLRDGRAVTGNYLGGTAREIRMEVGDHVQSFPLDQVSGIQFVNGAPSGYVRQPDNQPPPSFSSSSSTSSSSANYPSAAPGLDIPAGTQLTVRMIDSVDSDVARMGDTFRASLDEPVMVNGQAVLPRGADVVARLVDDQRSGKIQGRTVLKLVLTSVNANGRQIEISTQDVIKESSSRGARSAKVIGGTTALGAVLGGIAGGGRGAAIGAGSGAAVGTGAQELGRGQRVRIPSETRLVFTLAYAVRL